VTAQEIQNALSGMPHDSNWMMAVMAVMELHGTANTQAALQPGLDDAARHYNAGRAAGVEDVRADLRRRVGGGSGTPGGRK